MKHLNQLTTVFILLLTISCGRTQTISEVTGDPRIDSLINIHFPKERTAEYGLEAHPVSEEFTIPDDFLNNGVWFRRTYKYTTDDLHELLISLTEITPIKHQNCCFICHDYESKPYRTECSPNEVPIPTFRGERNYFGIEGDFLGEDFDIYMLDSQKGTFIPDRNLTIELCNNNWKHGFSRGIAISQDKGLALFWISFW